MENDPEEIAVNTLRATQDLLSQTCIDAGAVSAVALTNQRETAVVWSRKTGKPVYPAVVWQCRRSEEICARLSASGTEKMVKEKTGLVLSPYFSAAKIAWILEEVPGAREAANNGELLCGTIDSWLVWNLSGTAVHATDYSNASRTQLFNLSTLTWDDELLQLFRIPRSMLAEVRCSDDEIREYRYGRPPPITSAHHRRYGRFPRSSLRSELLLPGNGEGNLRHWFIDHDAYS